ncbi:acyltransferase [Aquipseudomonas alcaligenes]|uniref:Peptidoglycan/LPS O-acetylase OafA/YrhL, contains acyltransferase and SGNH-hydrolase domains n=1 Tax=Aquipseudomonas alcaligenes TaxID=43263 RepID=A0A1N6N5H4_AQUAC|nr:acyltransferase [Pseudomonas alcaligenes]SIP87334.1 Peptidoglycan/LPS O-acetylase OafA/YrhL, contains acyltransferase and SGNH-hydrolase domains [Pseudomonas alcaligenes]
MNRRIAEIEVLRGFAVLFVVVHHANGNLFTWSSEGLSRFYGVFGGWFGVDLFFAISGFVIARDLVPRLQGCVSQEQAIRTTLAFWVRRAWRLWPSAWLWLMVILFACVFANQSGAFGSLRTNFEATVVAVLQVANLRFAESFMSWPYGASFPYWSLSLEEQFYLLFPLVVLFSRRWLPYVLIALVLAQLFLVRTPMLMVFRTDALALGVLLALWTQHSSYQLARPVIMSRRGIGTLAMLGLFVCLGALSSDVLHTVSIKVGMIALISALLVWLASYDAGYLLRPGIASRALSWLGARSYAIYLIHVPAFFLVREIFYRLAGGNGAFGDTHFWPFVLSSGVLILLLAEFNYRLVEVPLRNRGAAVAKRIMSAESVGPGATA